MDYIPYDRQKDIEMADLVGLVFASIELDGNESITFRAVGGRTFLMYHSQDCCETVTLEDIAGDLQDLVGEPILLAEVSTNEDNPPEHADSFTWTFYKFATRKGYVDLRWLGQSNGYYSERVDLIEVLADEHEEKGD